MMDSEKLVGYIQSPFDLNVEDFKELEEVLIKYPYFQSANMLYVKAANNIKTEDFDKIVSKVSASIPNRELLHDLIMLTKKEVIVESQVEKEEESDTRKEIRERINQRKKIRILQKGEMLLESGKQWHQLIVKEFFTPMIQHFINTPELIVQTTEKGLIKSTQRSDFERNKEDREKRKEERMLKREERFQQKLNEDATDKQSNEINKETKTEISTEIKDDEREKRRAERMLEREKRFQDRLKEKTEKKENEFNEFNDIPETKIEDISTPIEITPEFISDENGGLDEKQESVQTNDENLDIEVDKTEPIIESKISGKKEKLIVEDIPFEITDKSSDHVAIEDIYDKIISSKKVDVDLKQPDAFIEIKEDIPVSIEKMEIETPQINEDIIIESDKTTDVLQPEVEQSKVSEGEEKSETILEFLPEENTSEVIIKDDGKEKDEQIDITVEKTNSDSEDIFEFIDKKEEDQANLEKKESKDKISVLDIEIPVIQVDEVINKEVTYKDPKTDKEDKETKAANDIFARIAAYKKKKDIPDVEKKVNKDELIEKFVNEQPSIKISESVQDESIDLSENSVKEKRPIETELMANIFINQGKFDQAIDIFEKLILKYPEKKDYFAARIEELQNLKG
jgi:hypothetical protein